ncbi:hypothetical protein [Rouxiella sp. Mn2063]|uniref:hypothetical protein n=1 Tax=Rouxiella sp. Mn2063 TaxID=3395262 RepID=UPI003BE9FA57
MPAFQAPRLRVQANDKTVVFHHCTGGILSALGSFYINGNDTNRKAKAVYLLNLKKPGGALEMALKER